MSQMRRRFGSQARSRASPVRKQWEVFQSVRQDYESERWKREGNYHRFAVCPQRKVGNFSLSLRLIQFA